MNIGDWTMIISLSLVFSLFFCTFSLYVSAETITLEVSKGISYSFNMLADDPEDPFFLGPPVFLSISQPDIIQAATIWIDLGPIRAEQVTSYQDGEFKIAFTQEDRILKLNIERSSFRVEEGYKIIKIEHDRFSYGNLGVYFGYFILLQADVHTLDNKPVSLELSDGTWQVITDFTLSFNLRLVNIQHQEPLSGFSISVLGYGDVNYLFDIPLLLSPTDAEGNTNVYYTPDPAGLLHEENGCLIPLINGLDFWLLIQPPPSINYRSEIIKVSVPLQESCGALSLFADVKQELTPISNIMHYELY